MKDIRPIFFHFVIPEYFPERGGIQQSLRRIAGSLLDSYSGSSSAIYVLETNADDYGNVHFVKNFMKKLSKPLSSSPLAESVKSYKQLRYLSLENLVKYNLSQNPGYEHLVVSFYASHTGFYSQMVASRFGLKHIASVRGSDYFINFLNHTSFGSLEFVLKHADHIVTTNNSQRDMFLSLYGTSSSNKLTTIHNAVEAQVPRFANRHLSTEDRTVRIFTDSGFSYKKGTDQIIDAFLRVYNEGSKVELIVAGDIKEEEKAYWKERITCMKDSCGDSFKAIGYQDSVIPWMEQSDIFISASLSEGCSNSRIMALCMGIPLISTDNGAISDYPFPMTNTVLVPVGNPSYTASCIREISRRLIDGAVQFSAEEQEERMRYFSAQRERMEWASVIDKVLDR